MALLRSGGGAGGPAVARPAMAGYWPYAAVDPAVSPAAAKAGSCAPRPGVPRRCG